MSFTRATTPPLRFAGILIAALHFALLAGCAALPSRDAGPAPHARPLALAQWPHRDTWTGVVFNGEKIGFTRRQVRAVPDAPGRFEIESEAAIRLRFLNVDKRINLRSVDRVRADLTLEAFRYENDVDGSPLVVEGRADERGARFTVRSSGSVEERTLAHPGRVYPASALALLPGIEGLAVGRAAKRAIFHGETQSIVEAEQETLAWETSDWYEGPAFRVVTRMLGVDTTTWIAADGRPLLERAMHGVLVSALEDEAVARRYLVEAALNKRDALVEFSLVRSPPIAEPRRLSRLEIALEGFPEGFVLPSEGGQTCAAGRCVIDRSAPLAGGNPSRYLKPTLAAPSNLGEIRDLALRISSFSKDEETRIQAILAWMDANIAKEALDVFTATDVLRERRAECQGHAYLFAALARALGIPTRIVNGLVYSEAHGGFLFHTWNEAWVAGRGWLPVDATFGQAHADATHLKLLEGEAPGELLPLVGLVGRVRVAGVRAGPRW